MINLFRYWGRLMRSSSSEAWTTPRGKPGQSTWKNTSHYSTRRKGMLSTWSMSMAFTQRSISCNIWGTVKGTSRRINLLIKIKITWLTLRPGASGMIGIFNCHLREIFHGQLFLHRPGIRWGPTAAKNLVRSMTVFRVCCKWKFLRLRKMKEWIRNSLNSWPCKVIIVNIAA